MNEAPAPGAGAPRGCCSAAAAVPALHSTVRTEQQLRDLLAKDSPPTTDELIELLRESHPLYDGRSAPEVIRMRGALLLALAGDALPEAVLPYVLEELESAHDAYLTAVAASCLRRFSVPEPAFVEPLLSALLYIRHRDDAVRLSQYGGYGTQGEPTTATAEVLRTLGWLGSAGRSALPRLKALREERPLPHTVAAIDAAVDAIESATAEPGPCCCSSRPPVVETRGGDPGDVAGVELEDQNGEQLRFADFFIGQPTIVVFFYTRCDNPTKCPLTITKLGRLQRLLRDEGLEDAIHTAAITYDPGFDVPARLEQYRRSWGAEQGAGHRMLRTTGDIAPLRAYFDLGVNYVSTVVNRHHLEAYVLDAEGRIAVAVTRLRWSEQDLLQRAKELL